jgi:hypothetical protein
MSGCIKIQDRSSPQVVCEETLRDVVHFRANSYTSTGVHRSRAGGQKPLYIDYIITNSFDEIQLKANEALALALPGACLVVICHVIRERKRDWYQFQERPRKIEALIERDIMMCQERRWQ